MLWTADPRGPEPRDVLVPTYLSAQPSGPFEAGALGKITKCAAQAVMWVCRRETGSMLPRFLRDRGGYALRAL